MMFCWIAFLRNLLKCVDMTESYRHTSVNYEWTSYTLRKTINWTLTVQALRAEWLSVGCFGFQLNKRRRALLPWDFTLPNWGKIFRLAPWKTLPSESYMSCKAAPIFYGVENLFKPLGLYISSGNILCHIFIVIRMVLIFRWVTEFKVNEHHFVCEYSKRKWFVMVIFKSDLTFKILSPLICSILLASCYRNYTFLVQRIFS